MQDPICAMKICGDINGDFSTVTECVRNCARLGNMITATCAYPIDLQFASDAGGLLTAHATTIGRNSALVSAAVAVQWNERVSTDVYYDGQLGRDN